MNSILLTAAGFSRNWGGWLALEVFEYLIGDLQIDPDLRNLLWRHKDQGFESALSDLQRLQMQTGRPEPRLQRLQPAIISMFNDMDRAFAHVGLEFSQNPAPGCSILEFLASFDAIFTLNQDLLLERHYLNDNMIRRGPKRWNDWSIPGMRRSNNNNLDNWVPNPDSMVIRNGIQPYIKLHGSSNWFDEHSRELIVLGGNKDQIINNYPILRWNHDQFAASLSRQDTRLMIIGYGFNDRHINSLILQAARQGNVRIFIVDPLGVDVVDKNRGAPIPQPDPFARDIWPYVFGASRRSLREIFGGDRVEHAKIMKFFL